MTNFTFDNLRALPSATVQPSDFLIVRRGQFDYKATASQLLAGTNAQLTQIAQTIANLQANRVKATAPAGYASANVQGLINELAAKIAAVAAGGGGGGGGGGGASTASQLAFEPYQFVTASNTQSAVQQIVDVIISLDLDNYLQQTIAARDAAQTAAVSANASAMSASGSATSAQGSATSASNSAASASSSAASAASSSAAAQGYAGQAQDAATSASSSANQAQTSATNAQTSATNAASSASNAQTSANSASTSATQAANSAGAASASATSAANSAGAASASASQAQGFRNDAQSAAAAAAASQSAAAGSASQAATSASQAATSADQAQTSASNAAASATNAQTAASNAATSAGNAAGSATASANSATQSQNSATQADTSAGSAANSANSAQTSANASAASASASATSAAQSLTSANNAAASRDLAQQWAVNPEDTPVAGGQFSSYHWAQKAEDQALLAEAIRADIQPQAASSRGRNTNFAVSGDATWYTLPLDVAVFNDPTYFSYESGTSSIVPSTIDQERLEIFASATFVATSNGTYRGMRVIAVNPANASDFVALLETSKHPSSATPTTMEISNISFPPKNWKLQLQVRHDYTILTVPQNINVTGCFLTVRVSRGRQGPPGVAVRETIRGYNFTATANQTTFSIPDAFDVPLFVITGGVPQQPASDYTVSGQNIVLSTGLAAGTKVTITTAQSPPGQATLLRVQTGTLAASATQIPLADPLDVVIGVIIGGVFQQPTTDYNPNYTNNRVDLTSSLSFATTYNVVYRRTATVV